MRRLAAVAGAPCVATVRNWAKGDVGFAAALVEARAAWGERDRVAPYDEAVAGAFLRRVAEGETVNSLVGPRPGAVMTRATYRYWQATQAPFSEAVFEVRRRRNAAIGVHGRARFRAFDQGRADRVIVALNRHLGMTLEAVLAADPALPCRPTLARWRREEREFDAVMRVLLAARRGRAPLPEVLVEDITEHIVEGGSFASYSRLPDGPSRTTLRRWHRRDPAFARQVASACEWRDEWLADQVLDVAMRKPPGPIREAERAIGQLKRQIVRLRHRPGAVHRAPGPRGDERGEV